MYGKQDDFERIHSNIKTWVRDLHAGKFNELDLEEITKAWVAAGRTLQSSRLILGEALSRRIIDPAGPPGPRALYADMETQVYFSCSACPPSLCMMSCAKAVIDTYMRYLLILRG